MVATRQRQRVPIETLVPGSRTTTIIGNCPKPVRKEVMCASSWQIRRELRLSRAREQAVSSNGSMPSRKPLARARGSNPRSSAATERTRGVSRVYFLRKHRWPTFTGDQALQTLAKDACRRIRDRLRKCDWPEMPARLETATSEREFRSIRPRSSSTFYRASSGQSPTCGRRHFCRRGSVRWCAICDAARARQAAGLGPGDQPPGWCVRAHHASHPADRRAG